MLMPDLGDVLALSALMLGLAILFDFVDRRAPRSWRSLRCWRRHIGKPVAWDLETFCSWCGRRWYAPPAGAPLRLRGDRRSAYARRRWPQPLSKLDGELVGWAMNGAAAPLIKDLEKRRGWKRWFAR